MKIRYLYPSNPAIESVARSEGGLFTPLLIFEARVWTGDRDYPKEGTIRSYPLEESPVAHPRLNLRNNDIRVKWRE